MRNVYFSLAVAYPTLACCPSDSGNFPQHLRILPGLCRLSQPKFLWTQECTGLPRRNFRR